MADFAPNPYTSPVAGEPARAELAFAHHRLDYNRAITFVFDSPDWIINIVAVVLCTLVGSIIPILPAMVLLGYQFEIIDRLTNNPHLTYPSFKFDQILQYLVRGLYPLVVAIVGAVVALPVLFLTLGLPILAMALLMAAVGEEGAGIVAVFMIPIIVCIAMAVGVTLNILILPMVLRAGLAQDIGAGFDLAFVKDFVRKMWKDCLKAGLFLIAAAFVAQIVGLLLFCVGTFVTVAVVQLAQAHLGMQLYRIYLSRGGEKIPVLATHQWSPDPSPIPSGKAL